MENDKIRIVQKEPPILFFVAQVLFSVFCFHFKFYISNQHFLAIARVGKEKVVNAIFKVVIIQTAKAYFCTKSLAIKTYS
jgi:hypothetical protein